MNRNCKPILKNDSVKELNINLTKNKFLNFQELVLSETDIYLISETKLDDFFPETISCKWQQDISQRSE